MASNKKTLAHPAALSVLSLSCRDHVYGPLQDSNMGSRRESSHQLPLDGDFILTQNAAIFGYIADTFPQAKLRGDGSARQRAETTRWLALANTDMQPVFGTFFAPGIFLPDATQHDALKTAARVRLRALFERANAQLEGKDWIAGFRSVADAYLYIMLRWADMFQFDMSDLPHLAAFKQRMAPTAACRRHSRPKA